jgi:hypothetical protein
MKLLAVPWKALSPEERAPYDTQAAKDKARFETETAEWHEKYPHELKVGRREVE